MDRLISEKAVLEAFREYQGSISDFYKAVKAIPSAEPKTGHWKFVQRGKYIDICCCNCGYQRVKEYAYNYTVDQISEQDIKDFFSNSNMNFCENCGARMVEPQESETINCKSTKCENCINHNYCDYEPQESEDKK